MFIGAGIWKGTDKRGSEKTKNEGVDNLFEVMRQLKCV